MMRRVFVLVCGSLLLSSATAWAQATPAQASGSRLGARLFLHAEWQNMAATKSFDAITGKTRLHGFGGGAEVQRIWKGLFARMAISQMSETGERVFVFENEVFPLGIPVELTQTPIDVAVGWRLSPKTSRRIVPYAGAGMLFLKYKETSNADVASEGVDESYNGVVVFGGVEVPVWRYLSLGGEVAWRQANVETPGGTFRAFNEKDMGGVAMRVMLSISR